MPRVEQAQNAILQLQQVLLQEYRLHYGSRRPQGDKTVLQVVFNWRALIIGLNVEVAAD